MSHTDETKTVPVAETDGDARKILAPDPCTDEELAAVDFTRLDVLVGTVRSDEQLSHCVESNTYYVPAKTVTPADLPVAFIALYEEGLTCPNGISRYGRVTETRVVKRSDIPVPMSRQNPEEAYYLFTVEGWNELEHPIAIQDTARGKPMFTGEFLLTHCRRSYQLLCIRSPEAYRLCRLLCNLGEIEGSTPVFRRVGEHHLITMTDGKLRLINAEGGCLYACPAEWLTRAPAEVLRGVVKAMGIRNG